jgi:hypothetical protein
MSPELIIVITVTIPLGWAGFIFTLWKWDSRRIEERAKEREHELKVTAKTESTKHQNELEAMRSRVDVQEQTLLRVQHTITMRVLKALSDSTEAEQELRDAIDKNFLELSEQTATGFSELKTEYVLLLDKIGTIAEQNSGVSTLLGEFRDDVEKYYNKLKDKLSEGDEPQATSSGIPKIPDLPS